LKSSLRVIRRICHLLPVLTGAADDVGHSVGVAWGTTGTPFPRRGKGQRAKVPLLLYISVSMG